MSFFRFFVLGLGTASIAIACSSGTSSTGTGGADTSSFLTDFCGTLAPCCAQINKPTDGNSCRALYMALTGAATYDATQGQACLSELHAAQSSSDFCSSFETKAPSCKGAYKTNGSANGTKQPGELCTGDADCASSTEGDVSCATTFVGNAETKACQLSIKGKENDGPCNETHDGNSVSFTGSSTTSSDGGTPTAPAKIYYCDTADGLYCAGSSTTGSGAGTPAKCTKIQAVGGACAGFENEACTKDAYCDLSTMKCATRVAIGGDCHLASSGCATGSYCTQDTFKCTASLADGATCMQSAQCMSNECVNTKCNAGSSSDSLAIVCGGN